MAHAPENTVVGFQTALDMGATGIESDVWVTADGVPVLVHDRKVGSRLRRREVASLQRDELPEHIPALADLYELTGPDFPISLDVKDPSAFGPVLDVVRAVDPSAESNLWLCHPDLAELTKWRPNTTARLINSTRLQHLPNGLERRAAELQQLGMDGLNLFHSEWVGGRVTLLHRFGLCALGWGAQHSREIAEIVDVGIDGVFSDHVDRMMAVIREYYR